ncbi:head GIN domain-containing protein [Zhouia amylolytica]|uniref:head GIN domain-containing protein n=1 Tax=Zhouia amylolytica TaxID=376730 RepID=UPI0020CF4664|nr:head GIN domain-containing protein [Zhouia amylolytica]MCQ0112826.1 DUF2807 domain-containing protein [Zhouia amylolytica]
MKKVFSILMFVSSFTLLAQDKVVKELGEFSEIKAFDGISVNLVKSDENKAIVTGDDVHKVVFVNNGGKLKIRMEIDKVFSGFETFVEVHYKGRIETVDVNENAFVTSKHLIKQETLELKAQEGGEIDLKLEVLRLNVKSITGGIIEASGTAKNQVVRINTGGQYEGDRLQTEQTDVDVNAGGTAYVKASELVEAKVRAGGTIRIFGKPKVIDQQKLIGGKIIEQ